MFKRALCFFLAGLMIFTAVPDLLFTVARAAPSTDIELSYVKSDEKDPLVATIVRGNSTTIKVNKKSSGYTEANPPFTVKAKTGDSSLSNYIKIADNINPATKDVVAQVDMPITSADGKATFSIAGNFYALLAEGDAYETAPNWSTIGALTKVEATSPAAIMENSEITIVCETAEEYNKLPTFTVKLSPAPTGSFQGFDKVSVRSCDQWSSVNGGTGKNKVLTIQLENSAEKTFKQFNIYPKQVTTLYKKNPDGTDFIDPVTNQKVILETNNYIQKDSTYRLVFSLPTSNELLLNVLTAKQAVENIAAEIKRNDGTNNQSYIKLAPGDQLSFITRDFSLNSYIEQYSTNFNVEWEWIPENEADKYALSIASSGTWRDVAVNPGLDDIRGSLVATVIYNKGQKADSGKTEGEVSTKSKPIEILIRGLGEPGTVLQMKEIIGSGPDAEHVFLPNEQALPSSKNMDVYNGSVEGFKEPVNPYKYRLQIQMGKRNASAQYAVVEAVSGDKDVVSLQTIKNHVVADYTFGSQIENPMKNNVEQNGTVDLELTAQKKGNVKIQITYYIKGLNNAIVKAPTQPKPITINVYDTSPSDDSSLANLVLKNQNKEVIDFGFSPTKIQYDIDLPYSVDKFTVTPTRNHPQASSVIKMKYTYFTAPGEATVTEFEGKSGFITQQLDLTSNIPSKLEITVTAENPNVQSTYVLNILRLPPSDDGTLKSFELLDKSGTDVLTGFRPDVMSYKVMVPYRTDMVQVVWEKNHPGAQDPLITSDGSNFSLKTKIISGVSGWIPLKYDGSTDPPLSTTHLTVKVVPENKVDYDASIYTFDITRLPPSSVCTLDELKVTDAADKALTYTPVFDKMENTYELRVPFETDKIKLSAKPTNDGSTLSLYHGLDKLMDLEPGRFTKAIEIPYVTSMDPYYELKVVVLAEDGKTRNEVKLQIMRAEPENNAALADLKLLDQDKKDQNLGFNPELYNYNITVPYAVEKVVLVPTASSKNAKVTVNGRPVESTKESVPIPLSSTAATNISVEVTAQDGTTKRSYQLWISRDAPSSDARLKGLVLTGTEKFKPQFIANKYIYTADVKVGEKGVTVTPTANDPYATITVNGKKVTSGTASELIETLEVEEQVFIVVTAQDGVTTLTYMVTLHNQNLVERSSNADLSDLVVNYGTMSPKRFQPSVTTYDVAVAEDTASVQILPKTADKLATFKVFSGSKEIGDYDGNYAEYIEDGENEFTVEVTSPDQTVTKVYTLLVHRNEEDKAGRMTPITVEDVDFSPDVILVDITKFTRVGADVFNEMKKYPDKRIVFQGNDYSIEFKGSDIDFNVPHTDVIDLGMTFTSPFEEKIWEELDANNYNDDLRPVFVHFYQEGALPAKAKLTLSLGKRYWNEKLYWHSYNEDRDRIDYYGFVETNNRGTFTVPLEHFGTYILTRNHAIRGSDNKTAQTSADLNNPTSATQPQLDVDQGKKDNPNTGVGR